MEVSVIRDSLMALGGQARWIPHEENPSDCLTKLKGNASRLVELLRTAKFKISMEEEELARRKAYREATGKRNPRPNKSTVDSRKPHSFKGKGKGKTKTRQLSDSDADVSESGSKNDSMTELSEFCVLFNSVLQAQVVQCDSCSEEREKMEEVTAMVDALGDAVLELSLIHI